MSDRPAQPPTDAEADYAARLFEAVLDAVISLDAMEGAEQGTVSPVLVRLVLAEVAATIDFKCGFGRVPSERRKTGEMIGARYARMLKSLIEAPDDGSWPNAVRVDSTRAN
jgi:hypothetical protein